MLFMEACLVSSMTLDADLVVLPIFLVLVIQACLGSSMTSLGVVCGSNEGAVLT